MALSLFLNSLLELYLSFSSEFLYSDLNKISILVLSLFVFFYIFFVGIPSIPTFWKNEHTQKHQGKARRRRKGKTQKGSRYYYSKVEEERELISFLQSPLGQNYDITQFRRLLCPDPSCKLCNNVAAEMFPEALKKSTPSVAPVAFTAPVTAQVTEPSLIQSSAFSTVPAGDLITPLPEPSAQPPSVLSYKSMTPLDDFLSPSPPDQTLHPEPVCHSSPKRKDLFSSTLTQYDFHQGFLALNSTKTSFGADPAAKLIDQKHLLFLNPDEHDSTQQYIYPKTWEDHLKQKFTQLYWGLPSLHSESLSSAVHASGDYSIFFNSISNAFTDQESPGPHFLPLSLPEVQPQPLPQTLPQSQHLHLTQTQPQTHLQSPLPILPSSPITQNKVCEVYFHKPKNESKCLTSFETEHLECHVLQKEQESLTSVVQSSKAHAVISIDPVEFPLSSEFREKFESHLRERLIQHPKGQPCMINRSLSQMRPLNNCSGIPESKSSSGLSWVSVDKDQSSENPNVGLSQPGSFYERSSESFQLEENEGKDGGHSEENDPKVHLLHNSKTSSDKDVGNGSVVMSPSRENSMFPEHSFQRHLENVWKVHLRKTFEEISESQLSETVHSSQHSIKQNPIKSHTQLEQRSLPSPVGGDYQLNTSQELPLLECGAPQMQKTHIPKFQMRVLSDLPTKVLKSKEHFKLKDTSSHTLINPNSSSSNKLISEVNTKSGVFVPLGESSESLHLDKVKTESSPDDLNFPFLATSLVSKKGHSPADIQRTLSEEIQKILKTKLPITNTISDKNSQIHSLIANIQPPKMPARRAGTGQETKKNNVNSNDRAEIRQGANREKSELDFLSSVSREIVRVEGLNALQLETIGILTTSKPGISQRINRETTVTTRNSSSKLSVQDPDLSELKMQVLAELKLTLEKKYSLAQDQPTDMSYDSDSLTSKASLTPAEDDSSSDEGVPQVLHVHSKDSIVSMEKQQEPWPPRHALRSCQDQNFLPAIKKDIVHPPPKPTGSLEFDGGDTQLRISQPGGERFPSQDTVLEDMLGSKSPQTLSQKGQAPPPLPTSSLVGKEDSHFLSKMKSFFQRLQPGIKCKVPESPQKKGISLSAQSRGPTAAFTGIAHVLADIGKFSKEKPGSPHAGVTTCPQEPLPSAAQSGKPVQKGAVQIQAEPVQEHPIHHRTPSYDMTNAMPGRYAAILAGQDSTYNRHTKNEDKHPPKVVTFKGQQISQKYPQSVPLKVTVPQPNPTCRPQAAKGPPAVLTTAGGTALRIQPPRFRHTMLLQNFHGETFPAPK